MSSTDNKALEESVKSVVGAYVEPHLESTLEENDAIKAVQCDKSGVTVDIELPFPSKRYAQTLSERLSRLLAEEADVANATVNVTHAITAHSVQRGVKRLDNIKNIIAVASGKGGVGKSTTSVNLALALAAEGAVVGLLDADIYGPSQPRMMGLSGQPESPDGNTLEPMENYGVQTMSIGFIVEEDTPMIWRGPMVTQALEQLLNNTRWRDLDYLVIDLPPGTGDTQLTLAQKVPVSGAVIVTTPQDIALLDARKGLKMFEKVDVPILGIVENMSTHVCSQCGHEEHRRQVSICSAVCRWKWASGYRQTVAGPRSYLIRMVTRPAYTGRLPVVQPRDSRSRQRITAPASRKSSFKTPDPLR